MNKRKYPFSLFVMGTFLNLIRLWLGFIVVIILLIICLVNPIVPIIKQLRDKNILLSHFDNEETDELLDKMFADNSKGYKNVTDAVDEIIKSYQSDTKQ